MPAIFIKRKCLLPIVLSSGFLFQGCALFSTEPPIKESAPAVKLAVSQVDRGVMVFLPDDVLFDTGAATLNLNKFGPHLDRLAPLLINKTNADVVLEGHTDNVGTAVFNQTLSERRAAAVRDALLSRGVPPIRMAIAGFGMDRPIAPNDTEAGRQLNRRVEIILLGETVENIKRGEPDNAFEEAFERLKQKLAPILQK